MLLLEGKKRFWFLPPEHKHLQREDAKPRITSEAIVEELLPFGLKVADLEAGDLIYFPG